jgi:hypothetical protein
MFRYTEVNFAIDRKTILPKNSFNDQFVKGACFGALTQVSSYFDPSRDPQKTPTGTEA